ncbi:peptidoglycan-binding protein [Jhaorihella thermophila]
MDARIGPLTINAVRAFQNAQELIPDGYPSPALLAPSARRGGLSSARRGCREKPQTFPCPCAHPPL